jgi:hypothetical protein
MTLKKKTVGLWLFIFFGIFIFESIHFLYHFKIFLNFFLINTHPMEIFFLLI